MLEGLPLRDFSVSSLLGIAVLAILLGWLVPKKTVDEHKLSAERWRQAYEAEREAHQLAEKQTAELLEVARTSHALIQAIFANSERLGRREREADAISEG